MTGEGVRVLPHPVRCEDCAKAMLRAEACSLDPLHGWPGVKQQGCLYYEKREARGADEGLLRSIRSAVTKKSFTRRGDFDEG